MVAELYDRTWVLADRPVEGASMSEAAIRSTRCPCQMAVATLP